MKKQIIKYNQHEIENRIFSIRDIPVMIDRDLAEMYALETKRLNEQVRRNIERFPQKFRFQLTEKERNELVANCDRFENMKHSTVVPYALTEQGVAMLSAVLRSPTAVAISIQIMDVFVEMRKYLATHSGLMQRMDRFELKQAEHDQPFERVFKALEAGPRHFQQGIFYDGQTFDAYTFAADLIRGAKKTIQLIDNYVDDSVLLLLTKRAPGVTATLYTRTISRALDHDVKKLNSQYEPVIVKLFDKAHDRFLIIDESSVYHIGASLKDLGKKWFAFSKIDKAAIDIIQKLNEV
jgi:phage regulator Rha-like protein